MLERRKQGRPVEVRVKAEAGKFQMCPELVDLDQVIPASDLEFPVTDPTPSDLEALIAAANASLAIASIIAVTGLAVGGIGIIVAWGLTRKSRKTS